MVTLSTKTEQTRSAAQAHADASASAAPQAQHATITSAVAAEPSLPPSKAAARLFPNPPAWKRAILRFRIKEQLEEGRGRKWKWHKGAVHEKNAEPDEEELAAIRKQFGYGAEGEPEKLSTSRLYNMMLADACLPLPRNPLSGVVSPPLLATTGIVPFSVFSTGPDIIQHYYDCIIAARKEVICLTNYWQMGKNVDKIADALRELNRRQKKRKEEEGKTPPTGSNGHVNGSDEKTNGDAVNGLASSTSSSAPKQAGPVPLKDQIVVKIMWDRGPQTLADLFRIRKPVPPNMWKANGLPTQEDVPYLSVEILNYHRPLMGTFHAKLLLVDRQVALINSNNIQDRPNLEACTRLEGDIVNSVYDHALISWGNRLNPPLPCLGLPASKTPSAAAFSGGEDSTLPHLTAQRLREIARSIRERLRSDDEEAEDERIRPARRLSFADVVDGVVRRDSLAPLASPTTPGRSGRTNEQSSPTQPQHANIPASGSGSVDKDQAARNAGAEWARKVLGERFHQQLHALSTSSHPSSPTGEQQHQLQPSPALATPSRRHFADVVYAMMEKEGIKPGLWAEGALDAFGLGPSSSRNVMDDARRSRTASKTAAQKGINVPHAVTEEGVREEEGEQTYADNSKDAAAPATGSLEPGSDSQPPLDSEAHAKTSQGDQTSQGTPSTSIADGLRESTISDNQTAATVIENGELKNDLALDGDGVIAGDAKEDSAAAEGDEAAPGARAYMRHRTNSTRSRASASERLAAITKSLDFANLSQVRGEITAQQLTTMTDRAWEQGDDFTKGAIEILDFNPYIFHQPHQPVPMALVNRRPHGTPGHSDIRNAQDAAWLAGFRYAKKHIFLQSPTLNATPIKHAVLHAVRRHVRVELWLGLGFNDKSESMPFQGGTNETVVTRLYRQLRREGKGDEQYLDVYWYTGKDMTRPLNAVRKQRNCHVKYVSFDGEVAIIGSGNQDTQSWFHSQEINVMVDSKQIVGEWDRALRRNQSTHLYGIVDKDGIWRGRSGAEKVDKGGEDK